MTSKLKIKMGQVEVEYEGEEAFLKEEFPELLLAISSLYQQSNFDASDNGASNKHNGEAGNKTNGSGALQGTTSTLASKLGAKTGGDLIVAAAAHLALVQQKESFTRLEIVEQMKSATAFHNKNYISNLSKLLITLVKDGTLNEIATNTYALGAQKRTALEAAIGGN